LAIGETTVRELAKLLSRSSEIRNLLVGHLDPELRHAICVRHAFNCADGRALSSSIERRHVGDGGDEGCAGHSKFPLHVLSRVYREL
jgi:hypothetical protein